MKWRLDPGQIEVMDDAMAEVLRQKQPWERVQMASDCHRLARLVIEGSLRTEHPDWTDEQIMDEVARRMLGDVYDRGCARTAAEGRGQGT